MTPPGPITPALEKPFSGRASPGSGALAKARGPGFGGAKFFLSFAWSSRKRALTGEPRSTVLAKKDVRVAVSKDGGPKFSRKEKHAGPLEEQKKPRGTD